MRKAPTIEIVCGIGFLVLYKTLGSTLVGNAKAITDRHKLYTYFIGIILCLDQSNNQIYLAFCPNTEDCSHESDHKASIRSSSMLSPYANVLMVGRLNFHHWCLRERLGYYLHPTVLCDVPKLRIADIATGTG